MLSWTSAVVTVAGLIHDYGPIVLQIMRLVAPAFPNGAKLLAEAEAVWAAVEKFKGQFSSIATQVDPATIPPAT